MRLSLVGLIAVTAFGLVGCSTAPKTEEGKQELSNNVERSLSNMRNDDPSFEGFLNKAYGYAVFPTVGKGGLGVGGAYGKGQVFEQGRMIGYADLTQATIGLQIGGQAYTEVIAFENKHALDDFTGGNFEFSAQASAVALKSGAAANAKYTNGIAIFTHVKGGLMAEASLGGQKFSYRPAK